MTEQITPFEFVDVKQGVLAFPPLRSTEVMGIRLFNLNVKSEVKTNERTSTEKRTYNCEMCNKKFSQAIHLIKHRRIHTGEKPYKCDLCEKKFSDSSNLRRHQRTHTGEKPYKCVICNTNFAHASTVKAHRRIHTKEKPYKCEFRIERAVDMAPIRKVKEEFEVSNSTMAISYGRYPPRNAERERTRVQSLRDAFISLQCSLPEVPPDTKLSKLDVLILASTYIGHLTRLLQLSEDNKLGEEPCATSDWMNSFGCIHPIKKWPMRARLYAGIASFCTCCSGPAGVAAIEAKKIARRHKAQPFFGSYSDGLTYSSASPIDFSTVFTLCMLELFADFNLLFQCPKTFVSQSKIRGVDTSKKFTMNFMKTSYIRSNLPLNLDPDIASEYLPAKDAYLGMTSHKSLQTLQSIPSKKADECAIGLLPSETTDTMRTGRSARVMTLAPRPRPYKAPRKPPRIADKQLHEEVLHEKRLKKIREVCKQIDADNWMYPDVDKLLGH
ncbi:hypothetical protein QYM36_000876 [Artemia franciscana]|uniref:Uncharacterized protein n=1 Tax=Artemia franciscana TaxID=6661 RepID=A0AA88IBK7_ARTSF|nr:hypothetical protein QYM36_000876 [Artemia franciscana]